MSLVEYYITISDVRRTIPRLITKVCRICIDITCCQRKYIDDAKKLPQHGGGSS